LPWYDCIFAAIMTGKTIIFTYGTTKNVYNCHNRQYLGYYVIRRIFQIFKKFLGRLIYFFNCFSLRSFSDTFPRNLYSILERTPGKIISITFLSKVLSKSFCKDYEIGHKPGNNSAKGSQIHRAEAPYLHVYKRVTAQTTTNTQFIHNSLKPI